MPIPMAWALHKIKEEGEAMIGKFTILQAVSSLHYKKSRIQVVGFCMYQNAIASGSSLRDPEEGNSN
ncbi:MAG: hypothetical protein H6579_09275 [Chitinophagales bacterium]|nr:hypothetical protein [Chitinophagales bacterium]